MAKRVPIIDVTDLYHPHQDPGDNIDILWALGLPQVDLRAVILDVTDDYRRLYADANEPGFSDPIGSRDPGVIPLTQLSFLFDRIIPFAVGPMHRMTDPTDPLDRVSTFEQAGIELILRTLADSDERVHILSFGSCRTIAAAFNRDPSLLEAKVARIHISAGATGDFLEWNVNLDLQAFIRLRQSDLPIAWYPCTTAQGPFDDGQHNTHWLLEDLQFIQNMHPPLQRYLQYVLDRECRNDFLVAMQEPADQQRLAQTTERHHHVWETAIWLQALNQQVIRKADAKLTIVDDQSKNQPKAQINEGLEPIDWQVDARGFVATSPTTGGTKRLRYRRNDPAKYQQVMRQLVPDLYQSIVPGRPTDAGTP